MRLALCGLARVCVPVSTGGRMRTASFEQQDPRDPHGIVIHDRQEAPRPPAITAFIWGGKVRPVPEIPYGRPVA